VSGLQASTSVQIARSYYFGDRQVWGENIPLYVRAVGAHRERWAYIDIYVHMYMLLIYAYIYIQGG
jgi:hypothetical protein